MLEKKQRGNFVGLPPSTSTPSSASKWSVLADVNDASPSTSTPSTSTSSMPTPPSSGRLRGSVTLTQGEISRLFTSSFEHMMSPSQRHHIVSGPSSGGKLVGTVKNGVGHLPLRRDPMMSALDDLSLSLDRVRAADGSLPDALASPSLPLPIDMDSLQAQMHAYNRTTGNRSHLVPSKNSNLHMSAPASHFKKDLKSIQFDSQPVLRALETKFESTKEKVDQELLAFAEDIEDKLKHPGASPITPRSPFAGSIFSRGVHLDSRGNVIPASTAGAAGGPPGVVGGSPGAGAGGPALVGAGGPAGIAVGAVIGAGAVAEAGLTGAADPTEAGPALVGVVGPGSGGPAVLGAQTGTVGPGGPLAPALSSISWEEGAEKLRDLALQCLSIPADEFGRACEDIVQGLNTTRQQLPAGVLKQLYMKLLFILTRCTRLLQFQKDATAKAAGHQGLAGAAGDKKSARLRNTDSLSAGLRQLSIAGSVKERRTVQFGDSFGGAFVSLKDEFGGTGGFGGAGAENGALLDRFPISQSTSSSASASSRDDPASAFGPVGETAGPVAHGLMRWDSCPVQEKWTDYESHSSGGASAQSSPFLKPDGLSSPAGNSMPIISLDSTAGARDLKNMLSVDVRSSSVVSPQGAYGGVPDVVRAGGNLIPPLTPVPSGYQPRASAVGGQLGLPLTPVATAFQSRRADKPLSAGNSLLLDTLSEGDEGEEEEEEEEERTIGPHAQKYLSDLGSSIRTGTERSLTDSEVYRVGSENYRTDSSDFDSAPFFQRDRGETGSGGFRIGSGSSDGDSDVSRSSSSLERLLSGSPKVNCQLVSPSPQLDFPLNSSCTPALAETVHNAAAAAVAVENSTSTQPCGPFSTSLEHPEDSTDDRFEGAGKIAGHARSGSVEDIRTKSDQLFTRSLSMDKFQRSPSGKRLPFKYGYWGKEDDRALQEQVIDEEECTVICRICEEEIVVAHFSEHSKYCAVADQFDLPSLSLDDRLKALAEGLDQFANEGVNKLKSLEITELKARGDGSAGLLSPGRQREADEGNFAGPDFSAGQVYPPGQHYLPDQIYSPGLNYALDQKYPRQGFSSQHLSSNQDYPPGHDYPSGQFYSPGPDYSGQGPGHHDFPEDPNAPRYYDDEGDEYYDEEEVEEREGEDEREGEARYEAEVGTARRVGGSAAVPYGLDREERSAGVEMSENYGATPSLRHRQLELLKVQEGESSASSSSPDRFSGSTETRGSSASGGETSVGEISENAGESFAKSGESSPSAGDRAVVEAGAVVLTEEEKNDLKEEISLMDELADIAQDVADVLFADDDADEFMATCMKDLEETMERNDDRFASVDVFGHRVAKLLRQKWYEIRASRGELTDAQFSQKSKISIDDFEILKPISKGAYGRVFLARKRTTGDLFAIKVLRKADMIRKNAVQSVRAERNILATVRNPFVVRCFFSFTCRENLYLVMEFVNGGDLYSLLKNLQCLGEEMAGKYIAELVLALEYLHNAGIVHRDLKPDNLLIAHDGHIKLTDFGLSEVGLINSATDLSSNHNNNNSNNNNNNNNNSSINNDNSHITNVQNAVRAVDGAPGNITTPPSEPSSPTGRSGSGGAARDYAPLEVDCLAPLSSPPSPSSLLSPLPSTSPPLPSSPAEHDASQQPFSTPANDSSSSENAASANSGGGSLSRPSSPYHPLGGANPKWKEDSEAKTNYLKEKASSMGAREKRQRAVGTPDYLAPEILLGIRHGPSADWWAVGAILFELITGIPPFNAPTVEQIFDNILNRNIPWPSVPDEMSYEAQDLIDRLLHPDPMERLGARGASEVKAHPFFENINWDTLADDQAAFVPSPDHPHDTSYFSSRHQPGDEINAPTGRDEGMGMGMGMGNMGMGMDMESDCESVSTDDSESSMDYTNQEGRDEPGEMKDFDGPVSLDFTNFSFKNLSAIASINDAILGRNKSPPRPAR